MLKKLLMTLVVLGCALTGQARPSTKIPWRKNITMIVVPRQAQAVRVVLDMTRYNPILPVCYQKTPAGLVLYAWNGSEWVGVSPEDYVNGSFFSIPPQFAVLVEPEDDPAPDALVPDGTWCRRGARLTSTDLRVMTHLLGLNFDLPNRYWAQLSNRYQIPYAQLNPSLKNLPWTQRRGVEKNRTLFEQDMTHWESLDITPPAPIEPVELIAPEPIEPAETPAEESMIEEPMDDMDALLYELDQVLEDEPMESSTEPIDTEPEPVPEEQEPENTKPVLDLDELPFSTNEVPKARLIEIPAE